MLMVQTSLAPFRSANFNQNQPLLRVMSNSNASGMMMMGGGYQPMANFSTKNKKSDAPKVTKEKTPAKRTTKKKEEAVAKETPVKKSSKKETKKGA
jgi:hypothetical protein